MRLQRIKRRQREKGVSTALALSLCFILVLLVYGFFQLALLMGGSSETRNATDAGALSVGKDVFNAKALHTKPDLTNDEKQYFDVSDSKNQYSLTNVNRVWGQSLLVGLNVQAMQQDGSYTQQAKDHADKLFDSAEAISDRLADQLNTPDNLYPLFNGTSEQNATNMLGSTSSVTSLPGDQWQTSLVDRGIESNIQITSDQLPGSGDAQNIGFVKGADGSSYVPGYKPIKVLDHYYTFVPFKTGERPHLISENTFSSNKNSVNPINEWKKPIPNAFSVHGATKGQQNYSQRAKSYVLSNPQRQFPLEMPYGFIKIHLDGNTAKFYINENYTEESYDYFPSFVVKGPYRAGSGTITAFTFLGMEYIPPTLYQAIHALPGDHSRVDNILLQRCREIKQNATANDLLLAEQCPIIPGIDDYIIFRVKDVIIALPFPTAIQQVLNFAQFDTSPDGSEISDVATEEAFFLPNFTFEILIPDPGVVIPVYGFMGTWEEGSESWTPGSGYNGCLGQLSITRTTSVFDFGTNIRIQ